MRWFAFLSLHLMFWVIQENSLAYQGPIERPRNTEMQKVYTANLGEVMVEDIRENIEEQENDSPRKPKDLKQLAVPKSAVKDSTRRPSSIRAPTVHEDVGGERNMQDFNRNGSSRW